MNDEDYTTNNTAPTLNPTGNTDNVLKPIIVILFMIIGLPIVAFLVVFFFMYSKIDDFIALEDNSNQQTMSGYNLTSSEQNSVLNAWSLTRSSAKSDKTPKMKLSDCQQIKNVVTRFGNSTSMQYDWIDDTYCANKNLTISVRLPSAGNQDMNSAYLTISSRDTTVKSCAMLEFKDYFTRIVSYQIAKGDNCSGVQVEVYDDGVKIQEIKPNYAEQDTSDQNEPTIQNS